MQSKGHWYHKECFEMKKGIEDVANMFLDRIDPNPDFPSLRRIINDLVVKENYDPKFLMFAIDYCLKNKWNLRYPAGLRYVAKNKEARAAWDSLQKVAIKREVEAQRSLTETEIAPEFDLDAAPVVNRTGSGNRFSGVLSVRGD